MSKPYISLLRAAVYPSPLSSESVSPPKLTPEHHQTPSWLWKYTRRMGYFAAGAATIYTVDRVYNASSLTRTLRTFTTSALITWDYKSNFTPGKSEQIPELHERVGQRVFDLLSTNGGLYIKFGQAIAANAAALPEPIQKQFASLFDDAPQVPYSTIHRVFVNELGQPPSGPNGVFEVFEEKAVASASIAQVHKAKLWPTRDESGRVVDEGKWVAVKVQKPDVAKQMEWDIAAFRSVMWMFEHWAFDLPVYFVVDFIADHLRQELDFVNEARNAQQTADYIAKEPLLRDKVYIPKIYEEYTTKKVMVAEWIDGVRLSDREGVYRLMGEALPKKAQHVPEGTTHTHITAVESSDFLTPSTVSSFHYPAHPLKGGVKSLIETLTELFSAQMFKFGQVHCDPHPGNILIRPSPTNRTQPQVVLLDHGLCVQLPEEFKREWAELWRAMLVGDFSGVKSVAERWGFGPLPDLVASFVMMRPTILRKGREVKKTDSGAEKTRKDGENEDRDNEKKRERMSEYELSLKMKQRLKEFLADTDRMPKVILFLNRNMRIMQGNNASFGSPVNGVKITGYWASKEPTRNTHLTFSERTREWYNHTRFQLSMFSMDFAIWKALVGFWLRTLPARMHARLRRGALPQDDNKKKKMTKEEMEEALREFIVDAMGIDLPDELPDLDL
uniref:ABC1 atypical kinase-like domain-containing protein n=1 Tax=Psilocybe cubensis TaxID=181762 RepID=A0A8H7XXJ9_PSICU